MQSLQPVGVCHLSAGFRAETGWGHNTEDQKKARKIQGNSIFLHLSIITSSSRLKCTISSQPVSCPQEQPTANAVGRTQEGDGYTAALPKKSLPALTLLQLCSEQPWTDASAQLLSDSSSHLTHSSSLSPSGVADRTRVLSLYWDMERVPKGQGDNNCPLCSSDALIPWVERDPRGGRLGASFPSKRAAVFESKDKVQDQVLHLQPEVGFKYKSRYNSFPLPFSLCCSELLALHSAKYSACSM